MTLVGFKSRPSQGAAFHLVSIHPYVSDQSVCTKASKTRCLHTCAMGIVADVATTARCTSDRVAGLLRGREVIRVSLPGGPLCLGKATQSSPETCRRNPEFDNGFLPKAPFFLTHGFCCQLVNNAQCILPKRNEYPELYLLRLHALVSASPGGILAPHGMGWKRELLQS